MTAPAPCPVCSGVQLNDAGAPPSCPYCGRALQRRKPGSGEWAVVSTYERDPEHPDNPKRQDCMLVERGLSEQQARDSVRPLPGLEVYSEGLLAVELQEGCAATPGEEAITDGSQVWTDDRAES